MKKKKLGFKKCFIIVSAVFIVGLIFAYSSRLIHFYLLENKRLNDDGETISTNYFSDILENTINVTDALGGLYLEGDAYIYKYNATENYLWYSGHLWRILKINDNKTISIITDEPISLIHPKYDTNDYLNSFLDEFYNKLNNELLVEFEFCEDEISDLKKITCSNLKKANITLLDMYTYNKTGNVKSFLNNGSVFWLKNKNSDNNYWYIDNNGSVGIGTDNVAHTIRPVVTLKNNIKLISGDGTKDLPYIIEENNNTMLSDATTGEFIMYNNYLWRILSINEGSITALKVECIKENDECLNYKFGNNNAFLNSNIYKYLNTNYYDKLENKDFLVKDKYYVGIYNDYNFETLKENTIEAYVGLPKVSEYYIQNNLNSYLITPNTVETVYTINENGNYYLVFPSNEKNIYPVINFDINLKITSGNGTIKSPYELGR